MRFQALGPTNEGVYPAARPTRWHDDYGTDGFVARDRPYIDDHPARRHGWEAASRWGTRPVREFDRDLEGGQTTARRVVERTWARVRNAIGLAPRDRTS